MALVTGRRFDFALPIAQQIGCPLAMIVNNGALVKSKEGTTTCAIFCRETTASSVLRQTPEFRDGAAVVFDRPRANQVVYEQIDWEDPQRKGYFLRNREFIGQISPARGFVDRGSDPGHVHRHGRDHAPRRESAGLGSPDARPSL